MSKTCPEPSDNLTVSSYPPKLTSMIDLFESLPEEEKRELVEPLARLGYA